MSQVNRSNTWQSICMGLLSKIMDHKDAWPFEEPVDPKKWDVPDYFDIIKEPMDLTTIKLHLGLGCYQHYSQVLHHILLVFENALTYNPESNPVRALAERMLPIFCRLAHQLIPKLATAETFQKEADRLLVPRPGSNLPLAPIHVYSEEWAASISRKIASITPISRSADHVQSKGVASRPHKVRRVSRSKESEGSGSESDGASRDEGTGKEKGSLKRPPSSSDAATSQGTGPSAQQSLPKLHYGFYLAGKPPAKLMYLPTGVDNSFRVEQLDPSMVPNWQEQVQQWRENVGSHVHVPGRTSFKALGLISSPLIIPSKSTSSAPIRGGDQNLASKSISSAAPRRVVPSTLGPEHHSLLNNLEQSGCQTYGTLSQGNILIEEPDAMSLGAMSPETMSPVPMSPEAMSLGIKSPGLKSLTYGLMPNFPRINSFNLINQISLPPSPGGIDMTQPDSSTVETPKPPPGFVPLKMQGPLPMSVGGTPSSWLKMPENMREAATLNSLEQGQPLSSIMRSMDQGQPTVSSLDRGQTMISSLMPADQEPGQSHGLKDKEKLGMGPGGGLGNSLAANTWQDQPPDISSAGLNSRRTIGGAPASSDAQAVSMHVAELEAELARALEELNAKDRQLEELHVVNNHLRHQLQMQNTQRPLWLHQQSGNGPQLVQVMQQSGTGGMQIMQQQGGQSLLAHQMPNGQRVVLIQPTTMQPTIRLAQQFLQQQQQQLQQQQQQSTHLLHQQQPQVQQSTHLLQQQQPQVQQQQAPPIQQQFLQCQDPQPFPACSPDISGNDWW